MLEFRLTATIVLICAVCKKQKVDSENRKFQTEWTDKYAFVLPVGNTTPMCLICTEKAALVKRGRANVKCHYETKHRHFEQNDPQNSEVRAGKINHHCSGPWTKWKFGEWTFWVSN